ncbi:MAG: glycosyltransferase [Acidimicrobiia bacterium]
MGHLSSVSFVSTYPPTRCGLATFTKSLLEAMAAYRDQIDPGGPPALSVLAVSQPSGVVPHEVVGRIDPGITPVAPPSSDYVILQHEFGIYGPDDGIAVLDIIDALGAPVVAVLHTVLMEPTRRQRYIIQAMARRVHRLVVMSETARDRLLERYDLGGCPVESIPHGAWLADRPPHLDRPRSKILTWGLLGPGKGLEQGIVALSKLRHLEPKPLYVIAGQTHPNVLLRHGERYRQQLADLAAKLDVADMVRFDNHYLSAGDLAALRAQADVCLLPYESRDQVTSGALVEAIGARLPVVATRFPHAVELLSGGAGELVDYDDPDAIALALERFLTDPEARTRAQVEIGRLRPSFSWSAVARRYEALLAGSGAVLVK